MSKKPKLTDFGHFAIIQTAFLGDVALALPIVQSIRRLHPDAEISFITTPVSSPLVSCCSVVNHVITFDKRGLQTGLNGIKSIVENLKERKVDSVIAPHRSFRTTMITKLSRPAFSVGFNKNAFSIFYKKRIKYKLHLHELERNHSLLLAFSDYDNSLTELNGLVLDISEYDKTYVESRLNLLGIKPGDKFITIAPGSIWTTKRWTDEYFSMLVLLFNKSGWKVVLTGSQADRELCSRIANISGAVNLAGETTIPQTLHLLNISSLLITNDSAPTHLAGIAGCRTLTIFGPTSPIFGFGPRGINDRIAEVSGLKCKPCEIHGSHKCPVKTHECMINLKPETIFEISLEMV